MNLDEVRVKINDINDQMLALFKERMELSKDVAAAKKEMNKGYLRCQTRTRYPRQSNSRCRPRPRPIRTPFLRSIIQLEPYISV